MITNQERQDRAAKAVEAYPADEPDQVLQSICDLIADLLHLANAISDEEFSAESFCATAIMHFEEENPENG